MGSVIQAIGSGNQNDGCLSFPGMILLRDPCSLQREFKQLDSAILFWSETLWGGLPWLRFHLTISSVSRCSTNEGTKAANQQRQQVLFLVLCLRQSIRINKLSSCLKKIGGIKRGGSALCMWHVSNIKSPHGGHKAFSCCVTVVSKAVEAFQFQFHFQQIFNEEVNQD